MVVSERNGGGPDPAVRHWKGTCRSCGCMVEAVNSCCVKAIVTPKSTSHFIHCPFCNNALAVVPQPTEPTAYAPWPDHEPLFSLRLMEAD